MLTLSGRCYSEPIPSTTFSDGFKQSHLSCSIITSEHLTILQLYQRGLNKDVAIKSLPNISRGARSRVKYVYDLAEKIGILNAYSDINTNFSRCSTLVHKFNGKPALDQKEHAYYFCSGENKVRFEILLQLNDNKTIDQIAETLPVKYLHTINNYRSVMSNKGLLATFDLLANNLKSCLNLIEDR